MNDETTSPKSDVDRSGFAPDELANNAGDGGAGDIQAEPALSDIDEQEKA